MAKKHHWIYRVDGKEVAWCNWHYTKEGVFVDWIYVEKKYRRNGYGLYLLGKLFEYGGNIYGDFVTEGGCKLFQQFLKEYIYE